MKLINIIEEDFTNYRKPGMFLGFPRCNGKCNRDAKYNVCQNVDLFHSDRIDISIDEIIERYKKNHISQCIICGGLEPFDSFDDLKALYKAFREDDDITCDHFVIYTGYYPFEIKNQINELIDISPLCLTIKFGRFIPKHKPHFDPVLGVDLASDNQFAGEMDREYGPAIDIFYNEG